MLLRNRILSLVLIAIPSILATPLQSQVQAGEENVAYVLERYLNSMGGRAALERIKSVRLSGTVAFPDGRKHAITVLKKKPDKVRVVLDTGILRFIQAYDGEVAWFSRESGKYSFHDRLRGSFAEAFIREAPLENVLVNAGELDVTISLGPDVLIANVSCYQVIVDFPDGSKLIHHLEKSTFLERRIIEIDAVGNVLAELVPGKFETVDSVAFAMQIVRQKDGKTVSVLSLHQVETNMGILDSAFSPPVELPPQ